MGAQATMTREELLALPVTIDLMTAARALGIGRTMAHQLARGGEFPVKVLRLGNRYKVVTSDLLELLGEQKSDSSGGATDGEAA